MTGIMTRPTLSSHSRFGQRVRRRYEGQLHLLVEGLPNQTTMSQAFATLREQGLDTGGALRVTRQLVLERLLALDCDVELYKAGRMPIAQFAALPYDRDILTHVYIKKTPGLAVHYQSVRATQTDFPILTCAAARTADGAYRFAIGARPMKAMLVCPTAAPDELPAAVQAAVPTGSNLRGSAAYRTHLVGVLVKRAVQALGNLEVL